MKKGPVLSLCIPTNGVIEWVIPVLDSIFAQNIDESILEVVVTDNGDNQSFSDAMLHYSKAHTNLKYIRNNSYMFMNQIEALNVASGRYLKFLNHRSLLLDDSICKIIEFLQLLDDNTVIYFSNGCIDNGNNIIYCKSFNEFISKLGRYISWTSGVGIWRKDFEKLSEFNSYDIISPHSEILFANKKADKYIIYNYKYFKEIDNGHAKKGNYDLFRAFAIEEEEIVLRLYLKNHITSTTMKKVLQDYKDFLMELYLNFFILNKECSYDLTGFENSMGIFFNKYEIIVGAYILALKKSIIYMKKYLN